MSVPNGLDLAARASTIESLALVDVGGDFSLTDVPEPRNLFGATVTTNFLQTFGAAPALGRDFVSEEQRAGQNDLVILTWALWQRTFKGDPAVVGRGVRINNRPVRVIGILPAEFRLGDIEVFRPLVVETERDRRAREFLPFVRLKRDVTRAQAEANLVAIEQQLQREYPAENDSLAIRVVPIEDRRAADARRPLSLLLTAAVFLLLIACVNVANLLLALGVAKRREYALRTALGCAASRLVVEVVVDCVVVFLVGGLLGVLLAAWSQDLLTAIASPYYGVAFQPRLDWRVLACSLALSTVIGVLSGLAPALQARRAELQDVLK
ncbi:MAG: ABC transporter permease, partial [Actinobacteria bacterium]|nr:ABC transporter permease [Actinomycetota bacterium]